MPSFSRIPPERTKARGRREEEGEGTMEEDGGVENEAAKPVNLI